MKKSKFQKQNQMWNLINDFDTCSCCGNVTEDYVMDQKIDKLQHTHDLWLKDHTNILHAFDCVKRDVCNGCQNRECNNLMCGIQRCNHWTPSRPCHNPTWRFEPICYHCKQDMKELVLFYALPKPILAIISNLLISWGKYADGLQMIVSYTRHVEYKYEHYDQTYIPFRDYYRNAKTFKNHVIKNEYIDDDSDDGYSYYERAKQEGRVFGDW